MEATIFWSLLSVRIQFISLHRVFTIETGKHGGRECVIDKIRENMQK